MNYQLLVIENNILHATAIRKSIEEIDGCSLQGIIDNGELAFELFKKNTPDLVLLDIGLSGDWDGITTANFIRECSDVPIIFITSANDQATFRIAKKVQPEAYLLKPINAINLSHAVELALEKRRPAEQINLAPKKTKGTEQFFFVTIGNKKFKLDAEQITFLEVEGKYTRINLKNGLGYEEKLSLAELEAKLPKNLFHRIGRSVMINRNYIDHIHKNITEITVQGVTFPVGRSYRKALAEKLYLL